MSDCLEFEKITEGSDPPIDFLYTPKIREGFLYQISGPLILNKYIIYFLFNKTPRNCALLGNNIRGALGAYSLMASFERSIGLSNCDTIP